MKFTVNILKFSLCIQLEILCERVKNVIMFNTGTRQEWGLDSHPDPYIPFIPS